MTRAPLPIRLRRIADRLAAGYGRPRRRRVPPMDALVETILSQHTSDANSGRAFAALKAAYPTWERAARARAARLERVIRSGGLAATKGRRIRLALATVAARTGGYDLSCLRRMDAAEADAWLRGLPGVGPKTRACVLLFGCGQPAFPVDTHVHRIARRAGLVAPRVSAARAHALLGPAVPAGRHLELHLNLIRLGRERCRARTPECPGCPIRGECAHGRRAA